jgi:dihydroflavonol-4-reductase
MTDVGTVLVTGGSGYIGGFCILQLLAEGRTVRTTLRSLRREDEVRRSLGGAALDPARLAFFQAELMSDEGWAAAVDGCSHVLHVASPIPPTLPKSDDELVIPAREGTLRVLRAAKAAGVRRTVVTASTAAVTYGHSEPRPAVFDESHWTDPSHPDTSPYIRSKAIAERAAWAYMAAEGGPMTMATVNPGAVLGPVLGSDFSASIEIVKKILEGAFPGYPRLGFPLVDVRDIADLHIRAMTHPSAAGERFIGAGEFWWMEDIGRVLKEELGPAARRVPNGRLPSWMVRLMANFDPVTRSVAFELDKARPVTCQKAKTLLGWNPRPYRDTIVDCARSLIDRGLIKGLAAAA